MRSIRTIIPVILALALPASAEEFTDALRAYLQRRVEAQKIHIGVVVGLVDEQQSHVVGFGKLDNGTDRDVDGDTLFEIGSVTKPFTSILLQDMVDRGEMALDDPVANYLPASVKVPSRNGKVITLRQLANHMSGLPKVPDNLDGKRADNPYADYTAEKFYAYLSRCDLAHDPGEKSEYSNVGVGLLGHAITLKAGADYESLVTQRICRPLGMESTRITLTPQMKERFVTGHNAFGHSVRSWDIPVLAGAGALRSSANDLLKFVSANLGLTQSSITEAMARTHGQLAWFVSQEPGGAPVISHGGGTAGCAAFVGFDIGRRRGVVVLSNAVGAIDVQGLGMFLLRNEWRRNGIPDSRKPDPSVAYGGQYRRVAVESWRAVGYIAGGALVVLGIVMWRTRRGVRVAMAGIVVVVGVMVALFWWPQEPVPCENEIGIRNEAGRMIAQAIGPNVVLPPGGGELVGGPGKFFERLGGTPIILDPGKSEPDELTMVIGHRAILYKRVSRNPPPAPSVPIPHVRVKLDAKLLDACAGEYQFEAERFSVTLRREGDHLVGWGRGEKVVKGEFGVFPESETKFFLELDGEEVTFVKNDKGEVTGLIHNNHVETVVGKKVR